MAKPKLLDLAQYPAMTFEATGSAMDDHRLAGTLTAHGRTTTVELHFDLTDSTPNQMTVTARTSFDRTDVRITAVFRKVR